MHRFIRGESLPFAAEIEQGLVGDIAVGVGIGTEYQLNSSMVLEFEWMWRYFLTEDEKKWDVDETWSNTHAWNLSVGLTYGF